MDKEQAKLIASFEQGAAGLGEFAVMLGSYHAALCEQGFQRHEALELVKGLQKILFSRTFNQIAPEQKPDYDDEGMS
jgi:hypothetical protein